MKTEKVSEKRDKEYTSPKVKQKKKRNFMETTGNIKNQRNNIRKSSLDVANALQKNRH